jgi:hypothetical protein
LKEEKEPKEEEDEDLFRGMPRISVKKSNLVKSRSCSDSRGKEKEEKKKEPEKSKSMLMDPDVEIISDEEEIQKVEARKPYHLRGPKERMKGSKPRCMGQLDIWKEIPKKTVESDLYSEDSIQKEKEEEDKDSLSDLSVSPD